MIAYVYLKGHSVRKNQLRIPVYRAEVLLRPEMRRSRTGDFLVMVFAKVNKRKFKKKNDDFKPYKIGIKSFNLTKTDYYIFTLISSISLNINSALRRVAVFNQNGEQTCFIGIDSEHISNVAVTDSQILVIDR